MQEWLRFGFCYPPPDETPWIEAGLNIKPQVVSAPPVVVIIGFEIAITPMYFRERMKANNVTYFVNQSAGLFLPRTVIKWYSPSAIPSRMKRTQRAK